MFWCCWKCQNNTGTIFICGGHVLDDAVGILWIMVKNFVLETIGINLELNPHNFLLTVLSSEIYLHLVMYYCILLSLLEYYMLNFGNLCKYPLKKCWYRRNCIEMDRLISILNSEFLTLFLKLSGVKFINILMLI